MNLLWASVRVNPGPIKDELQPLSESASTVGYQENDADRRTISELAEVLRDAIVEYQVCSDPPASCRMLCLDMVQFAQQKSLYEQNCRLIVRLQSLCLNTDQVVLTSLSRWQVRHISIIE